MECVLFVLGPLVVLWTIAGWVLEWCGTVRRLHSPFGWHWGQCEWEKEFGLRHWGFFFTEPNIPAYKPPMRLS